MYTARVPERLLRGPFDAENSRLRELLAELTELAHEVLGKSYVGCVLSGSLAKAGGVVVGDEDGTPKLVSDIDLYILCNPRSPDTRLCEEKLNARVHEESWILGTLDLSLVSPNYFSKLPPSLASAQLLAGHAVLSRVRGDWLLPAFDATLATQDVDDCVRLLLNRLAEIHAPIPKSDGRALRRDYAVQKLLLDAPFSFLAACGQYLPTREDQWQRLSELAHSMSGDRRAWLLDVKGRLEAVDAELARGEIVSSSEATGPRSSVPAIQAAWAARWIRTLLSAALSLRAGASIPAAGKLLEDSYLSAESGVSWSPWLLRRGRLRTLREARRWAPLARTALSPWWAYGAGGMGPERLYATAGELAVSEGTVDRAGRYLLPVLPRGVRAQWSAGTDSHARDLVGKLWRDWIVGGDG